MIFYYHNDIDANMILYNLNLDEVNQLTKYLSELIYAPMIIGFTGDLGTGKTQFIKFPAFHWFPICVELQMHETSMEIP